MEARIVVLLALICMFLGLWYGRKSNSHIKENLDNIYDYIIVGAGSAGCVLANRLSEDPDVTVLLLEAGDDDLNTPTLAIPALALSHILTDVDWNYKSEPQKHACFAHVGNKENCARGKVLGGTSSIDTMVYIRGSPHDYDTWASQGCEGWSYQDVLPYFKKSENNQNEELRKSKYHGTDGPLYISDTDFQPLGSIFADAAEEIGLKKVDVNGENQEGVMQNQQTVYQGVRMSTSTAFLRPVMQRKNLHVATLAHVTKILFKGKQAVGVEFIKKDVKHQAHVRKEVILSAGTYGSAQLLMLSGVGPKDHLQNHKIDVIADLPVGQTYQDHVFTEAVQIEFDEKITYSEEELS